MIHLYTVRIATSNHRYAYTHLITQVGNIKNHVLISYKPFTYSKFLTLNICFIIWASSFIAKPAKLGNQEKQKIVAA